MKAHRLTAAEWFEELAEVLEIGSAVAKEDRKYSTGLHNRA